jgi:prolyl 4-hydroxylase
LTAFIDVQHLLRIDEKRLRHQENGDSSNAEALQLVHYGLQQEYTAHHDFGYAAIEYPEQPARFSTLLLYLNEGMTGGETEFPRWVNGETRQGLKVTPKKGKAVLFYSQLPDGNMDDLSHHSANPIKQGEKYLINLWVWDPKRD